MRLHGGVSIIALLIAVLAPATKLAAQLGPSASNTTIQVTAASEALTTLASFGAQSDDGVQPYGNLVLSADGNFYGATVTGGANTLANKTTRTGTIFRATPSGAVIDIIFRILSIPGRLLRLRETLVDSY